MRIAMNRLFILLLERESTTLSSNSIIENIVSFIENL